MSSNSNARAVSDQFQRTLKMLRVAITAFPIEEWRKGELAYLRPAGIAYHVLETIDYYAGDQPADQFPWGGRFGVGWEESESAKLPSREQLIEYLDEVEANLGAGGLCTAVTEGG
jgi:hypothetical protein